MLFDWDERWLAAVVHGLSVPHTHNPLTLRTRVRDQVSSLASSVRAAWSSPGLEGHHHVVPAATQDVSLHLCVDVLSLTPGHPHRLATQRAHRHSCLGERIYSVLIYIWQQERTISYSLCSIIMWLSWHRTAQQTDIDSNLYWQQTQ